MLESYLYEADDDWKKEKFKDPVSGEDKSIESGLSSGHEKTRKAAAAARDKIKPKKGEEEPETKPDTTDQDSKAKEKGEEPSGEEPSGEEPSGEEPKKGVFDKPGSGKADDYLGGDDEPEDKDSEFGKDYTSKFTGTDEPSGEEPKDDYEMGSEIGTLSHIDQDAHAEIDRFAKWADDGNTSAITHQVMKGFFKHVKNSGLEVTDAFVGDDTVRITLSNGNEVSIDDNGYIFTDDQEFDGPSDISQLDLGEKEPSGEEPSAEIPKPKREPVKVNYDGKSGEKGSTGKGATGRWAAWHGYSGKSAGFDSAEAAAAWASGAYDDPEDAIKVGKAAEEKRIAASKKEAAESAAAIKKEVENAPPEAKSWYEEKVGSKIDKVLDFFEDLQSNEGPGKEESVKVINGKKYSAIKESKKHPLKEQYDRLFTNRTII